MKKYQWCLSFMVLIVSILFGSLWYITPIRVFAYFVAWRYNSPYPNLHIDVDRIFVPSKGGEVLLQTDHYYPRGANLNAQQYPTVMMRSPYGIDINQQFGIMIRLNAYYLSTQGYHVIAQNVRGRFGSTGEYSPMKYEREDGFATMQWIKEQPWFNGKFGTAGVSYLGFTQYSVFGKDAPIQLSAAVPVLSAPCFYSITHSGDAPILDTLFQWNFMMDVSHHVDPSFPYNFIDMFSLESKFNPVMHNASLHFPITEADEKYYGKPVVHYRNFLTNYSKEDDYWKVRDHTAHLATVREGAVHVVGGWYDMFIRKTFDTYARLEKSDKKPFLTIYAGHHGSSEPGLFYAGTSLPWLDYKLKGKPFQRSKPVAYVINPSQEWKEVDSWPPETSDLKFYLQTEGKLANAPPIEGSHEIYNYNFDPTDPTPILAGNTLNDGGAVDNFEFLTKRKISNNDILLFYSSPLLEDIIITGSPKIKLWVTSSIPHADFYVRLLDHDPTKNVSMNICDGWIRLTDAKQTFFEIEIEFDPTAYKIQKGHAVMLEIASSAHPHYPRNPGTGEHLSVATKFLKAERQVSISPAHPSTIS